MRISALAAALLLLIASCGGGNATEACVELREPADSQSLLHVIDPADVEYESHPPTSGPHLAAPVATGLIDFPLDPALQVRVLEAGNTVIQYENLTLDEADTIRDLADLEVVVAPGVDLPANVVATAWTWKLLCDGTGEAAIAAIEQFASRRGDDAPGAD